MSYKGRVAILVKMIDEGELCCYVLLPRVRIWEKKYFFIIKCHITGSGSRVQKVKPVNQTKLGRILSVWFRPCHPQISQKNWVGPGRVRG